MRTLPHFVVRPTLTRLCSNFDSEIENYALKSAGSKTFWKNVNLPQLLTLPLAAEWVQADLSGFAQSFIEWMCIKHFCQMVLIPALCYCQHTVILLLYMFMVATLNVTLEWYLHICLALKTFPVCWLKYWPNTDPTDPEQIADKSFEIPGTKCSFKHTTKIMCLQKLPSLVVLDLLVRIRFEESQLLATPS